MAISGTIEFNKIDEVAYGKPAADTLTEFAQRTGAARVFLVVNRTVSHRTDEIAKIRNTLDGRVAGEFDEVPAHSPRSAVVAAANAAREANADLIATIGGGSVTDAAKAVQLCLANDVTTPDGIDRLRVRSDGTAPTMAAPTVRQVSVPTTLSAGEFTAISGVLNEKTKSKEMLRHPLIVPKAVILDPAVTVHTPEWLWLSTGIRAVDHCVEGLCSGFANPYGDAQAMKGLELLGRGLPRVKADPEDLDARLDCQIGAWLSMGPFASGVPMGASHGIGYILGAVHDVPHGYTSCVMLPDVMRWNHSHNADRQALVSTALGQPGEDAGDVLDEFIAGLGLPRSLGAVGVDSDDLDHIAHRAMKTSWIPRNPRPISGPEQVREILEMALGV
jgi:maleylacetate reductase